MLRELVAIPLTSVSCNLSCLVIAGVAGQVVRKSVVFCEITVVDAKAQRSESKKQLKF